MQWRVITPAGRAAILNEAAAILRTGGVVAFPTDTVYGLAAHPAWPGAAERLNAIKGSPSAKPVALLASDASAAVRLAGSLSPAARRLAEACWPGALTLVIRCGDGGSEGVRVPDHDFARELIAACGGLLRVTSANLSGRPPALTADEARNTLGTRVDMVIDGGRVGGGVASTVVRDEPGGCRVLRIGAIDVGTLRRVIGAEIPLVIDGGSARRVKREDKAARGGPLLLFVCSGNTCRSPMAEVLARARLPRSPAWRVASAGTMAVPGQPASEGARQSVAELGLSLEQHRSRLLTPDLVKQAVLIVAMSRSHFDRVVELWPSVRDKVFLLRGFADPPQGDEVIDPVGGDYHEYRACRDAISDSLPGLIRFLAELA